MGLRFLRMSRKDSRRLRRHVVELTSIVGHRDTVARLHDVSASTTTPIHNRKSINSLFEQARQGATAHTIIPADRSVRCHAVVATFDESTLKFNAAGAQELRVDDQVFVLYTVDFVSYSFQSRVLAVGVTDFELSAPELLYYSERRATKRESAGEGATLTMKVPWSDEPLRWSVVEMSPTGFSFRADSRDGNFLPGTPLHGAVIHLGEQQSSVDGAVINNVNAIKNADGTTWLRG